MRSHPYTEDQLVEQPAIALFGALGWRTISARQETLGPGGTLGRETKGEVVLAGRLRAALERFNPTIPPEGIAAAIEQLTRDRSAMSLEAANHEIYQMLKQGVPVSVPNHEEGGQRNERLRVVDWEDPAQNDFLLVSQLTVVGSLYPCRPDLVGFVNGLPFVVAELKNVSVPARTAFDDNLTHYKAQIPALFWYNAFLIASNGTDSRIGSLTAKWEHWREWKRAEREDEPRRVSLEVLLRGVCAPERLLDLVENFTLFSQHKAGLAKIIAQNHQYLGVNNAIASMLAARQLGHERGGVFWQTPGSGKSFSMVFFAQKVLRKQAGNWTFVIVTDRKELDEQIATTFKAVGAVSQTEGEECHAASGAHLRELLRGNHRYIFTLVQKFQTPELLCDRADVMVLTDEAHRSQYATLALNMRAALPRAMFFAFTGTPLIAGEEQTREVFGDYVSIYDFQQSVQDGATVPLYYQNRTPELQLTNPNLNEDVYRVIEEAGLDAEQEAKLERVLGKQYHLITRDDRLQAIASDVVRHFLGRGFIGKAMVISIDKATTLRMFNKVRECWDQEKERTERELGRLIYQPQNVGTRQPPEQDERVKELKQRLDLLATTDMAVVVSPGQNEIAQMQALGLDIEPHRRRMNESQPGLDERFKDTADPLRLVFVCAMWLTGFDVPSCSTLYLDKPMRNHTLIQTMARANRVFPGKHSGTIVDYANVFASLEQAMAIYGPGGGTGSEPPARDKQELVMELRAAIAGAARFCAHHGVQLDEIVAMGNGSPERLSSVGDGVNALIAPDDVRSDFFAHEQHVRKLYDAVKPDPIVVEFAGHVALLRTLADAIRAHLNPTPPDISAVMERLNIVLDNSIIGHEIREQGPAPLNISNINFEALAKRFGESKQKNIDLERLKAAIRAKLERMMEVNPTRTDFTEKFKELIESYNNGSRSIEGLFEELLKFSNSLNTEQERHVREAMTEEELVMFDILTRPAPALTAKERTAVKQVARELLARLKNLLVLNWRQKQQARAEMANTIQKMLDDGLPPAYTPELYNTKCTAVFEHIYERYPERGAGIYAAM